MDFNTFDKIQIINSSYVIKNGGQELRVIEQKLVHLGNRLMLELHIRGYPIQHVRNVSRNHFRVTLFDEKGIRLYRCTELEMEPFKGDFYNGNILRFDLQVFPFVYLQKTAMLDIE